MLSTSKHERFPRAKYARRIGVMMDEIASWRSHYAKVAQATDSPALERKAFERHYQCDQLMDDLSSVMVSLRWMS